MRKVKWGVLGCANFAKNTAIPAMQQAEGVELYGIASRNLDKAQAFAQQFGFQKAYGSYEEMLADPEIEAVYNPLPNGLHPEWTIKTAEAGKHSITEKPFAGNVSELYPVKAAVDKAGVKVMEAFMWRFHPAHLCARDWIRNGEIGELRLFRTAFTFTITREANIRLDSALAGGGIMDVGCYCISESRFFFDAEPTHVFARADIDPEYNVDMLASGTLLFPNGRALFDCGFELPYRCAYEIVGSKGSITCPNAILPGERAEVYLHRDSGTLCEVFPGVNQWSLEFEHLSKCVVEGTPLAYDMDDAIRQQKVIDSVYRSVASGQIEAV